MSIRPGRLAPAQERPVAAEAPTADQGRLGGLLKLCLASGPAEAAPAGELRRLLQEIEHAQRTLRGLIDRL